MITAPSHMYAEEHPALLKTPPAKAVDTKATGNPNESGRAYQQQKTEPARGPRGHCHK